MGQKKRHRSPVPVPPGNRPSERPSDDRGEPVTPGAGFSEQDPKRRLGNYTGAGEPSHQQPGGQNDANRESRRREKRQKDD